MPECPKIRIGLDDAGRGNIAGPLVITAFHHPDEKYLKYVNVRDSKGTDAAQRRKLKQKLERDGRAVVGYAAASAEWINQVGVDSAEAQCVRAAIDQLLTELAGRLAQTNAYQTNIGYSQVELLVDGNKNFPNLPPELEVQYVPKGDGYVPLISAASMLAGGKHDELMDDLAVAYPAWRFDLNRGHGTPAHAKKLYEDGPTPCHRLKSSRKRTATYALGLGLPLPRWLESA